MKRLNTRMDIRKKNQVMRFLFHYNCYRAVKLGCNDKCTNGISKYNLSLMKLTSV